MGGARACPPQVFSLFLLFGGGEVQFRGELHPTTGERGNFSLILILFLYRFWICVLVPVMDPFETVPVADRLAMTLDGLCRAVAARIAPGMAGWVLQVAVIRMVWIRIRRIEGRLQRLLARFQAGQLRVWTEARSGRAGGGGRCESPTAKPPRTPTAKLPRRFGWLMVLVPYQAAGYASQLRHLLEDPEMIAFLQASAQARRVLRPLGWMLGIEAELLAPVTAVAVPVMVDAPISGSVRPEFAKPVDPPPRLAGSLPRLFPPGAG